MRVNSLIFSYLYAYYYYYIDFYYLTNLSYHKVFFAEKSLPLVTFRVSGSDLSVITSQPSRAKIVPQRLINEF